MGNWMTMMIEGTCDLGEVSALREWFTGPDYSAPLDDPAWSRIGPLTISDGLCGLGDWPAEVILRVGNAYERDYDPESVAAHLRAALGVAPSLDVKVHCGGDYESLDVVASVLCRGGAVGVGEPVREKIPDIPEEQITARLMKALHR